MNKNDVFFVCRSKHTGDNWDKGIEVKTTLDNAKQAYHAYLQAYAYGHDENTDYVQCKLCNGYGSVLMTEVWPANE